MQPANHLLTATGTTIFTVMSALAVHHDAINLGQGFPDTDGPADLLQAAADALMDQRNQYPPLTGVPELRQAVAAANKRFYGLDIDSNGGVVVTSGATEAITACLMALINPGDEVILIEPLYDTYLPVVKMLGAVPVLVRLDPPDWALPRATLAAAVSAKTKLLLLNSPMNPCGQGFHAGRAVLHRRPARETRCLRRLRRGLRAPGVRPRQTHPAHDPARHGRAHPAHRQRRQDLFAHRLESRATSPAPTRCAPWSPRPTKTSPSPPPPTCSAPSPRASPNQTGISPPWPATCAASATSSPPASRRSASASCRPMAATSSPPTFPPALHRRRPRLLPDLDQRGARHRHPRLRLLPRERAKKFHPLRLLQARRGAARSPAQARCLAIPCRAKIDGGRLTALPRVAHRSMMADVAQLVERRFVVPVVAGSIPVVRPIPLPHLRPRP